MPVGMDEILETIRMIGMEHLDIRTVTMGINLRGCAADTMRLVAGRCYDRLARVGAHLVDEAKKVESEFGLPIVNTRVAVTPISWIIEPARGDPSIVAEELNRAAEELGIDFLGGYTALVHKSETSAAARLIDSIPAAIGSTQRVCGSVNVASTRAGINMDAIAKMGRVIVDLAQSTRETSGSGCCKLVVFANAVEDNPFMAGAFVGAGEGDASISVGISGPGVINAVVRGLPDADLGKLADEIRKASFKITRMGEMVGRRMSKALGVPFNVVDLSLAPTPAPGDSVGDVLEAIGVGRAGGPGSTVALMLLNDAVKKGGLMATGHPGGLSGAFVPVTEDATMAAAAHEGVLSIEKLEAMTTVCSVGLDMIVVPGDTSADTIAATIADEMAIGVVNNKTTAVRIIPAPGKSVGDWVDFGGLLGAGPAMPISRVRAERLMARGGRIPPPVTGMRN